MRLPAPCRIPPVLLIAVTTELLLSAPAKTLLATPIDSTATDSTAGELRHLFDNGLRLSVREDPAAPLVEVEMSFGVGSGVDADGREGTAHLLEHLMIRSSTERPHGGTDCALFLHSVYANAETSVDRIRTVTRCLPSQLDSVLAVQASVLRGVDVDPDELERERAVVLGEIAYRRRDVPANELFNELMQRELDGHPYGRPVAGTLESVASITREDLLDYDRRWLQPDIVSVAIVGPVDPSRARDAVEATLGRVEGQASELDLPPLPAPRGVSAVLDNFEMQGFVVGRIVRVPLRNATDLAMIQLLDLLAERAGWGGGWWPLGDSAWIQTTSRADYFLRPDLGFDHVQCQRDANWLLDATWDRLETEVRHLRWSDSFPELREEWVEDVRSMRDRRSGTARDLGEQSFDVSSRRIWDEAVVRAEEMTRKEVTHWLRRALADDRVSAGVVHGRDSGRYRTFEVAGAGRDEAVVELTDPLDGLDAHDVEAALARHREAGGPRIETRPLGNAAWSHVELPHARELHVGTVIAVECLEEERSSQKPGIARIYADLAQRGYRRNAKNRDRMWSRRDLPFGMTVRATPTRLRLGTHGSPAGASDMVEAMAKRLDSASFDTRVWRFILETGPDYYRNGFLAIDERATHFLMGRALGAGHPALHRWVAEDRTFENLNYDDMEETHEAYVREGARHLWTVGPTKADELAPLLEPALAQSGHRERPDPNFVTAGSAEGPAGEVFAAFGREEVQLHLVAGVADGRGLDWARVALLESLVESRCYSRLRAELGLAYWVRARAEPVGGQWVLEVSTGSNPEYAHTIFRELVGVLAGFSRDAVEPNHLLRARLRALRTWTDRLNRVGGAAQELPRMIELGPPPTDPLQALFEVDDAEWKQLVERVVRPRPVGFAVVGPVLEDERGAYLRILDEETTGR